MNDETEQPDALDRITIETRTMLALEKIAVELHRLNFETYVARMKILANQYDFSKEFDKRLNRFFDTIPPRYDDEVFDEAYEEAMERR